MPVYLLYVNTRFFFFWVRQRHVASFFTYEDAASYAHCVLGHETSDTFTIVNSQDYMS